VLLCDADGCLFPSEEPAYERSAEVMNAMLAELGVDSRYTSEQLRRLHTGKNYRTTATVICRDHGVDLPADVLEHWVGVERTAVTEHLRSRLRPDSEVQTALDRLSSTFSTAVVSSSAAERVDACLDATSLDGYFPRDHRFSAEDSLSVPRSKPDPAIYRLAGARLDARAASAIAVEDSSVGTRAGVAAGYSVVGLLHFVPDAEREQREGDLLAAGAAAVVDSWEDLVALI